MSDQPAFQDYILKADGTRVNCAPKNGKDYKLKELKKIVGGWTKLVVLKRDGLHMFVNEEGIRLGLPVNMEATRLFSTNHQWQETLRGDVLVCAIGRVL